uniref:Ig-like domain-containing protein n=1 Tax=Paramormyrops kingsleyae TaxID=1676925 RepID=A0A3B3S2G9_9TELE
MNTSWDFLHFSFFHTDFPTGHGEGSGVTQNPAILWAPIGNSSQMNCSHNKDASYFQMYWYHQRPGENMQLIVFTAVGGTPDFGNLDQSNYEAEKHNFESGSFSVKNLKPEDSGVYFCAVSQHSDAE